MSLPAINPMMSMYGGYDPYLMMALNSYNPYSSYMSVPAVQTAAPQTATVVTQPAASPTFQRGQSNAAGGKNKAARVVFPLILTAGAAFLCHKSYKIGQGETFFKRLGNGFKNMFSSVQSSLNKLMPKCPTVTKIDDNIVVTIPDKKNCILGLSKGEKVGIEEINKQLTVIGEKPIELGNISDRFVGNTTKLQSGNRLLRVDFIKEIGGKKYEVRAINGGKKIKLYEMADGSKTPVNVEKLRLNDNDNIYSQVKATVNDIMSGKAVRGDINITRMHIANTNANTGLISHIKVNKNNEQELISCVSDKFTLDHWRVSAYADNNSTFSKAVEAAENGD